MNAFTCSLHLSEADRQKIRKAWETWTGQQITREHDMRKSELVDVTAKIRGETEKAWCLFDGERREWVPKSQVEDNGDGTFTMPHWLAVEKGFI